MTMRKPRKLRGPRRNRQSPPPALSPKLGWPDLKFPPINLWNVPYQSR